ncbi:hypothetical protein Emed_004366 [Eimeria media]
MRATQAFNMDFLKKPFSWLRTGLVFPYRASPLSVLFLTSVLLIRLCECEAYEHQRQLEQSFRAEDFKPHDYGSSASAETPDGASSEKGWEKTLRELQIEASDGITQRFEANATDEASSQRFHATSGHSGSPSEDYLEVLDTLDSIARHESADVGWLNIHLEPYDGRGDDGVAADNKSASRDFSSRIQEAGGFAASMLQLGTQRTQVEETLNVLGQEITDDDARKPEGDLEEQKADASQQIAQGQNAASNPGSITVRAVTLNGSRADEKDTDSTANGIMKSFEEAASDFRVAMDAGLSSTRTDVDFEYSFPVETSESRDISFVVVALPRGYTIEGSARDSGACRSTDPQMPPLKCSLKTLNKNRKKITFVVLTSADPSRNLPLGKHSFKISANLPPTAAERDDPWNWWFATFRFTGGHAVTKHFEDTRLIARRQCVWSAWRQESPCSSTCGGGFEIWTRTLFAGPGEAQCGGNMLKRKCQTEACSLSCHLQDWQTVTDCTRRCGAKDGEAFRVRIRKVLVRSEGWGHSCSKLYPWNDAVKAGWSEKLQAVVSLEPCENKFEQDCPAVMGCRVEELNARTLPESFPWGVCPFPCGGFGKITSIVQVANGIPRWVGEKAFPGTFQIPCKADKEPIVITRSCNTQACEDCSVFLEKPEFGKATRAWIFFLPTLEGDHLEVAAPKGMTIISENPSPRQLRILRSGKISRLSQVLPLPGSASTSAQSTSTDDGRARDALGSCLHMANSFGGVKRCQVGKSQHYEGLQSARMQLKSVIEPSGTKAHGMRTLQDSQRSPRPHWLALPIVLGQQSEMEDSKSFYVWLTSSAMPRAPERFRCRLKTELVLPQSCTLSYTPKNVDDCKNCSSQEGQLIEAYRQFVPAKHGGSCEVPAHLRDREATLISAPCHLSCSLMPHRVGRHGKRSQPSGSAVPRRHRLSTVSHITRARLKKMIQRKVGFNKSANDANRIDTDAVTQDTTKSDGTAHNGGGSKSPNPRGGAGEKAAAPVAD